MLLYSICNGNGNGNSRCHSNRYCLVLLILLWVHDGQLGKLRRFFGGISAVLAILVTYCIFISQQRLSYKIGLNSNFSEMLRTLKEIGVSNRDQVNNSKAAILKHFTHINNEKTNELDPNYLAKAYHFFLNGIYLTSLASCTFCNTSHKYSKE